MLRYKTNFSNMMFSYLVNAFIYSFICSKWSTSSHILPDTAPSMHRVADKHVILIHVLQAIISMSMMIKKSLNP